MLIQIVKWIPITIIILLMNNCNPQKYTPSNYPKSKITIGNGGGFTGEIIEFCLFQNGTVYSKSNIDNKYKPFGKLKKSNTRKLFKTLSNIGVMHSGFSHPGNITYFITLKNKEGKKRITWGDPEHVVSEKITIFYKEFMNAINQINQEK